MVSLQKHNRFDNKKPNLTKQQCSFYNYFNNSPLTSTPLPNSVRRSAIRDNSLNQGAVNVSEATNEKYPPSPFNRILAETIKGDSNESMCNVVPLFHENNNDDIIVVEEDEPSLTEIPVEEHEADDTIHFTPELFDNENNNSPDPEEQKNCTQYQMNTGCMGSVASGGIDNAKLAVSEEGLENDFNSCNIDTNRKNEDILNSKYVSSVAQVSSSNFISNAETDQIQRSEKKRNRLSRSKNRGLSTFDFE